MPHRPPANPDFARFVETLIGDMPIAQFLRLRFLNIASGGVVLEVPLRRELSYTDDTFQAGIVGTVLDLAGGAACATLLPAGWSLLTVDYTIKFVGPTRGERLLARAQVSGPGRLIATAESRVWVVESGHETLCATGLVTMRNFEPGPA